MNASVYDPTEAELRAAWEVRRRHGWPHSFEETMENPVLRRIVKMHALHGMRGPTDRRERITEAEALAEHRAKVIDLPPYDPAKDRKRLAGNDKD